jgi:hypothetical protein
MQLQSAPTVTTGCTISDQTTTLCDNATTGKFINLIHTVHEEICSSYEMLPPISVQLLPFSQGLGGLFGRLLVSWQTKKQREINSV